MAARHAGAFFYAAVGKESKNLSKPVVRATRLGMYVVSGSDQQKRLAHNR
jgi:hypothetical protein